MADEPTVTVPDSASRRGRVWLIVTAIAGMLVGAAIVLASRQVTGPPKGSFWALFLLPLLQLFLSPWPIAAVVIALIFRKELGELLLRMKQGPGGTVFAEAGVAVAQATEIVKGKRLLAEPGQFEMIGGSADLTVGVVGVAATGEVGTVGVTKSGEETPPTGDVAIPVPVATAQAKALRPTVETGAEGLHPTVSEIYESLTKTVAPLKPPEERLTEALRILADLMVGYDFEQIYRVITGSQIDALLLLNARPQGVQEEAVKDIYRQNPSISEVLTLETWWWYLNVAQFVRVENGLAFITPRAELFLDYLRRQRYTERKAY